MGAVIWEHPNGQLWNEDVLDFLEAQADESVQCVVTSPPYWGLRDYGIDGQMGLEATTDEYRGGMVAVFTEVRRVLRDDGTLWLNMGDGYAGSWGGQSRANGNDSGSTLEGASMLSARQISEHPKGRRIGSMDKTPGLKPKDLIGMPWRLAFALQADGWWLRSDIIWSKPNPMPESVTDRPTKAHEYIFLLTKSKRYHYDAEAVREPSVGANDHDLSGGGYGVTPPGQRPQSGNRRSKKPDGWATHPGGHGSFHLEGRENGQSSTIRSGRNLRSVWEVATQSYPEAHYATFPEKLIEPCILAGCPGGGTVMDPFAGSGTVGQVASRLGRRWVLNELNPEYCEQIKKRCAQVGLPLETP